MKKLIYSNFQYFSVSFVQKQYIEKIMRVCNLVAQIFAENLVMFGLCGPFQRTPIFYFGYFKFLHVVFFNVFCCMFF